MVVSLSVCVCTYVRVSTHTPHDEQYVCTYLIELQVLRLICIHSLANNGLKPKLLELYEKEILHVRTYVDHV